MKKVLAILLATLLAAGMMSFGASADTESVTVALSGSTQAIKGESYEVTLSAPTTVGGIQGEIDYDEAKFKLTDIAITSAFATANKITDKTNLITDDGKVIKFALLPDKAATNSEWVTFIFTVLEADGKSDFTLNNVKVSDNEGVNLITEGLKSVSVEKTPVYVPALDVAGASVKTDGQADIRFEIDLGVNNYKGQIEEIGVIMIPTRFVAEGQELVYDTENVKYSGKTAKRAYSPASKIGDETIFYANLLNSSTKKSRINTEISARAYIKLKEEYGGTVIYSDNLDGDKNIAGGTSSRSCIDVMKGVAANHDFSDNAEITTILKKANGDWELEDYAAVVAAVNAKLLVQ